MPGIPLLPNQVPSGRISLPSYSATDLASQLENLLEYATFFRDEMKRVEAAPDTAVTQQLNEMDFARVAPAMNDLMGFIENGRRLLETLQETAALEPKFTEVGEP